jgi:hypothetical protein
MAGRKLLGRTEARLFTPPLRPLNRRTSDGFYAADFADLSGDPLLPWQRWASIHALELNPDGSYRFRIILIIVARQQGKSHLKRSVSLWRMYMRPRSRILGVAQEVRLAREQWKFCQDVIHDTPDLAAEWANVRNVNGDEYFWLANGSRYAIGAASRKSGRGGSNDEVNIDELREQRNWDAWASLSKTTMARDNSQIWCMSNAGDDESVVLNNLRDSALAGREPSIGIFEWSAEDGCELDDPAGWRQANPGLGYTVSEAAIRTSLGTDPPEVFRTEVLCQRVEHIDGAISGTSWRACADPAGNLEAHKTRIAACVDVAPDGAHVTLAVAAKLPDGRVRAEIAAAWPSTSAARNELPALLDKIQPVTLAWYPSGPAAALAPLIRQRPGQRELKGAEVGEACQGLADLVRDRRVLHNSDPLLDSHIGSAQKLPSGDGWRFTRRARSGEAAHVDAAYAAAGAVYAALTQAEPQRPRIRILRA